MVVMFTTTGRKFSPIIKNVLPASLTAGHSTTSLPHTGTALNGFLINKNKYRACLHIGEGYISSPIVF